MNTMMTKCDGKMNDKVNLSIPLSLKPKTIQNCSNFKRSSELARFMFYEDGSWVDYESQVFEVVKLGFGKGLGVVEAEIGGFVRLFDFYRMIEIDLVSGKHRSVAWIDVDGKCFFPKVFVSKKVVKVESDNDLVKIEIEIKLGENFGDSDGLEVNKKVKLTKRKREEEKEGSSNSFNAKRRETESQSARWRKTRALGEKEKGFTVVEKLFMSGLSVVEPGARVSAIHQCVRSGPMDKARCQVFAKQMEITKRARGDSRMVFAWFGTSAKGVESVLNHGFGMPACEGVKNRDGPGVGVYLSPARSPQNSAMLSETDENGEKHVVLCRVILGRSEKVQVGSEQSYPSSVEYDTGVDDLANPNWYTVWHVNMNTHILPECVVSYRPVKAHGLVNGMSTVNWMPHASVMIAKLIAKLKDLLPPPKISQLGTLCGMFKEGKLEKDGFMKHLRRVVGDDILRSTIQEIRG